MVPEYLIAKSQKSFSYHLALLRFLHDQKKEVPPLCLKLRGHSGRIQALAVLLDGRLASGSEDCTVKLWDTETGACVDTLQGHTDSVIALAVLLDGRLASGSKDCSVKLWDTKTGTCTATLRKHRHDVTALAVLPDGRLASGSEDCTVKLWNTKKGTCVATLKHSDPVLSLAVLPGGYLVSASGMNSTMFVWDTEKRIELDGASWLCYDEDRVSFLAVLPDDHLASGSTDFCVRLWDMTAQTFKFKGNLYQRTVDIRALTVLLDGRLAVSSCLAVTVWNTKTMVCEAELKKYASANALAVLPDSRLAIANKKKVKLLYVYHPDHYIRNPNDYKHLFY